jgi:hypothetical protein
LLDITQGGGATLDVGVYTIAYTSMILGCKLSILVTHQIFDADHPERVTAVGYIGKESKVDESVCVNLGKLISVHISLFYFLVYPNGKFANLYYSITAPSQREARIIGIYNRSK